MPVDRDTDRAGLGALLKEIAKSVTDMLIGALDNDTELIQLKTESPVAHYI
jgi:hypothetical protein